jgi:predicted anti-sigma-YlaC factor YlaD
MNEINCEDFLMAKMAELDGEKTEISAEQIQLHLDACENCRQEFAQMQNTHNLLKRQNRREQNANLWAAIEERIEAVPSRQTNWQPFLVLGAFLVAYKLLEMLPETDLGLAFKIVPVIFVVVLFAFLKENPFKINTELILEE